MWFPLQLGHFSSVRPQSDPLFAVHPTTLHLWSVVRWWPEQYPHSGLLPHLFSMWPHQEQSSPLLSGPSFLYVSTWYPPQPRWCHYWLSSVPSYSALRQRLPTTRHFSPFRVLSLIVRGFAIHLTWVWITIPSFSASNSSRIFCRPCVPFPKYHMRPNALIFSLSQDSLSSTSTTPLSTVLAAVMMRSRYCWAISAVAFGCVIALIPPLACHLAFMTLLWAGAFWWKRTLLIADAISWTIILESGTLSSALSIRLLSAILDPTVGAGPGPRPGLGPTGALWLSARGGTVSHRLAGVGVGAYFGLGTGWGFWCSWSCSLGLGFGCCCCCGCSRSFGPSSRIVSACGESSTPPPSVLAVTFLSLSLSSWPCATPFVIIPIMFCDARPPHLVGLVAGVPLLLSLLHPRHHCQPLCLLAGCTGFHQVSEISNCSVQLRQFLCLLLYRPLHAAPPVAVGRWGFVPPSPFSILVSLHLLKYVCARSLRHDGCRCCRHLYRHVHRRVAPPLFSFARIQVTPHAHSEFGHHSCGASLFVLIVTCALVDASRQSRSLPSL